MTGIARELDETLKSLNGKAAGCLERLVRDAIELIEAQNGHAASLKAAALPPDFFTRIANEFGPEPFERPPQGNFEKRKEW